MDTKFLEDLGLSNTEAKVYLALLELGSVTANKIAEKSGIHRRTVYDVLEILIEKGIVSFFIEANKKYYQTENPSRFLELIEERKKEFQNILPVLLKKRESSNNISEISVYRGKKGLINIYEMMLKSKIIYSFGSSGKFKETLGEIYHDRWIERLRNNRCCFRSIQSISIKEKEKYPKEVVIRYLDEKFISPSSTTIWGDYVFIQIFSEQPSGVLIKSKEVAESYLRYFELLWKQAKP